MFQAAVEILSIGIGRKGKCRAKLCEGRIFLASGHKRRWEETSVGTKRRDGVADSWLGGVEFFQVGQVTAKGLDVDLPNAQIAPCCNAADFGVQFCRDPNRYPWIIIWQLDASLFHLSDKVPCQTQWGQSRICKLSDNVLACQPLYEIKTNN
jgi:hypothetical protein